MKKKDWLLVILPLIVVFFVDRITKISAQDVIGLKDWGFIKIILHHNHGAMLGLFSDLPPVLRIVSLSTGGAFLLFSYFIIQYLLPIKSLTLRSGMSFLLGGILGNVFDRIIYGYVIDFLVVKIPIFNSFSPAMNLADVLQWFGYALIVYALLKEGKVLWPEDENRKNKWINYHYQIRYCFVLTMIGIAISLIAGTFSYTYLRVSLESIPAMTTKLEKQLLYPFIITFSSISLAFCCILFYVGLFLSHRAAGPVYAFESFLRDLANGKIRKLRLRTGDEFAHLEKVADELTDSLAKQYKHNNSKTDNEVTETDLPKSS